MQYLFTPRALKDIKKLPPNIQKRIVKKLDYFMKRKDPIKYAEPIIDSTLGQYRYRIGDYRAIIDLDDTQIIVLRIGHRKNIYK